MKKPEDDINQAVNELAKAQLEDSLGAISDSTLQKLAAARQKAILTAQDKAQKSSVTRITKAQASWHKPMWAMAASVCLAVPIWYALNDQQMAFTGQDVTSLSELQEQASQLAVIDSPLSAQSTNLTTLDIMTNLASLDEDELEILEDLEFALWLGERGLGERALQEQAPNQQGALGAPPQSAHG